eukprot:3256581-Rhodomonas_salina.1
MITTCNNFNPENGDWFEIWTPIEELQSKVEEVQTLFNDVSAFSEQTDERKKIINTIEQANIKTEKLVFEKLNDKVKQYLNLKRKLTPAQKQDVLIWTDLTKIITEMREKYPHWGKYANDFENEMKKVKNVKTNGSDGFTAQDPSSDAEEI